MLNFIFFLAVLTLSALIFGALWRLLITPINKHFVVHDTPAGVTQFAWLLLQVYIVWGWAALCVRMAHLFASKPGVVLWLGYYILAFFWCGAPLNDTTRGSTNIVALFSLVAFIAFAFFPILARPWHWFLRFV